MSLLTTTSRKAARRAATISRRRSHAIARGYRSGLEAKAAEQIADAGHEVLYETDRIEYTWPERKSTYRPDFKLPKPGGFFYVETKGVWTVEDRQKHHLLREQRPDLDIRFVFSNCNARLYKKSPTTYAAYCDKHGLTYANKVIPQEWLDEGKETSTHEPVPTNPESSD